MNKTNSKSSKSGTVVRSRRHPKDRFIGKKFGNCEVREKLNEGGTAVIYKAFNVAFKMFRVLKILKPSLSDEGDFYIRFIQEAQLTARLDHPNILRVFDTGEVDGYYYIEMEYIEGITLRTLISNQNRIRERDTLNIASQLVKALNYAHNVKIKIPSGETINGILHRDIKPENIMITPNRVVKLMDFGAAKPLNLTSNTMQRMIVGTFHYMSPEQIDGKVLDGRSDFFSLGIVLYELFTGQKPFISDKLPDLITKIKASKYRPISKVRAAISPMTEELIDKLLSRLPQNRPSSIKEIEETILICLHAFSAWGAGKKVRVPFSLKKHYPTLSLIVSIIALLISLYSIIPKRKIAQIAEPLISDSPFKESSISLLEKGKDTEKKGLWLEAIKVYETVPSPEEGGLANEYLEAQIRSARISFLHFRQFTKARSVLEKLRMDFSDPAIDAYLGQIYYRLALYNEARDRLDAAVKSKKASIILQDREAKGELLYYYAQSLDRQFIYIDRNANTLMEAIKAWKYYAEFNNCRRQRDDKRCIQAKTRIKELEKIEDEKD